MNPPPTTPSAHPPRFVALHHRNFSVLWSGLLVSNVGTMMQNVANLWVIWQFTHSPLWLGYVGLSFAIPMSIFPLFSGTIVDRVHRVRLLYITQTTSMIIAFVLAGLYWAGLLNAWVILVATFLGSLVLAFDNPARQALIPELVPREHLLNALSLMSASYNGAALVGPAIAGALLPSVGAGWLFALNGVSFLAVIFALTLLRGVASHSGHQHASVWESLKIGFAFAWRSRLVRALLLLSAAVAVFGRSYQNLLPNFAHLWGGGSLAYGLLLASAGGGALVGAFGLAARREVHGRRAIMVGSGLVFSASLVAFALSPWLWLGVVLQFVAGVSSTVFGAIAGTFIQIETPAQLRGRVMSFYSITLIGLPSLGVLGVGALAEWLGGAQGTPRAVLYGALALAAILLLTAPTMLRAHVDEPGIAREPR
ncbi:MAG TPA: MFS transporter [Coriobacteriia bacterium]